MQTKSMFCITILYAVSILYTDEMVKITDISDL